MIKFKYILGLSLLFSLQSFANGKLISASSSSEQDILRLELSFDQMVDSNAVGVQFNNKMMTLTLPDLSFKKNFPNIEPKSSFVKNLKLKNGNDKNIYLEIEFIDVSAMQMKENLALESMGKTLVIEILPPAIQNALPLKETASTSELPAALPNKATEFNTKSSALPNNEASATALEESKIPLFEKKVESKSNADSGIMKIALMVIGLLSLGGYLIWFLKNKSKMVNGPESLMKIKMITQFHLGPKKSLAVIRIAGESLLLSVTDTQISLIKTLSLLDEDLPEMTPTNFAESLDSEDRGAKNSSSSRGLNIDSLNPEEEFSFGPAVKTSLTPKIPFLRKII